MIRSANWNPRGPNATCRSCRRSPNEDSHLSLWQPAPILAAQTAEIIAEYTSQKPDVVPLDALAPGSSFEALLKWSRDSECESVCWVGHAPDVGWLTAALVGDSGASLRFAKGSVASVRMDEGIVPGAGELMWLATAKVLGV